MYCKLYIKYNKILDYVRICINFDLRTRHPLKNLPIKTEIRMICNRAAIAIIINIKTISGGTNKFF